MVLYCDTANTFRYYQRFGEIKRQAAIDFLLGHTDSPELRFLQSCASPEVPVQEVSNPLPSTLIALHCFQALFNDTFIMQVV